MILRSDNHRCSVDLGDRSRDLPHHSIIIGRWSRAPSHDSISARTTLCETVVTPRESDVARGSHPTYCDRPMSGSRAGAFLNIILGLRPTDGQLLEKERHDV
jgi:hypothetical protein